MRVLTRVNKAEMLPAMLVPEHRIHISDRICHREEMVAVQVDRETLVLPVRDQHLMPIDPVQIHQMVMAVVEAVEAVMIRVIRRMVSLMSRMVSLLSKHAE